MTSPNLFQRLHRLDRSPSKFHDQLSDVLQGEDYRHGALNLQGDGLVWLVDYLDEALDDLDPPSGAFRKCLSELRGVCGTRAILPTSYMLSGSLQGVGSLPFVPGGSGDVYEGILDGTRVSIKRARLHSKGDPEAATKALYQEAVVWKHLAHPNIVPFLGVYSTPLQLISKWMPGGALTEYIKKNTDTDRLRLLLDVANGLYHLHSCNVIHGDLKASNILVDHSGTARIASLGMATLAPIRGSIGGGSYDHGPTTRWIAPEVLRGEQGPYSKPADIFSFAMVMIEVFTGAVPFNDFPAVAATFAIIEGKRPPRPSHPAFTDQLWTLMQRCWIGDYHLRPEASELLKILRDADPPAWKLLISGTPNSQERVSLITNIFEQNGLEIVRHLRGGDAQAFVDVLDKELDSLEPRIRERCMRYLCQICGRQALIPRSLKVEVQYDQKENQPFNGGFADVQKGQYDGRDVAVKVLRTYSTSDFEQIRNRFCKELMTWKGFRHPNVLPLIGAGMTENRFTIVSEWVANGNINGFVKAHAEADRLALLRGATRGLIYMHDMGIVHGDLKGANILVDRIGHARLADFGLLTVISDQPTFLPSCIGGGTIQWMSPELLDPGKFGFKQCRPTKESDIYALGMVIYEVLSGREPYALCKGHTVIRKVLDGESPRRPRGEGGKLFTDGIWRVVKLCWEPQPSGRANAKAVLSTLKGNPSSLVSTSNADGDVEKYADDQSDATSSDSCPSVKRSDNGLLVSPQSLPRRATVVVTRLSTTHTGDGFPAPLYRGSSKGGFTGRSRRIARKMFRAVTRGFCDL